jgi:hypothetical protein
MNETVHQNNSLAQWKTQTPFDSGLVSCEDNEYNQ